MMRFKSGLGLQMEQVGKGSFTLASAKLMETGLGAHTMIRTEAWDCYAIIKYYSTSENNCCLVSSLVCHEECMFKIHLVPK